MKSLVIVASILLSACATQHRPPVNTIQSVYIDCYNRVQFERWFNSQLQLTDMSRIELNSNERAYYAAIKDRLWTLRSSCQ